MFEHNNAACLTKEFFPYSSYSIYCNAHEKKIFQLVFRKVNNFLVFFFRGQIKSVCLYTCFFIHLNVCLPLYYFFNFGFVDSVRNNATVKRSPILSLNRYLDFLSFFLSFFRSFFFDLFFQSFFCYLFFSIFVFNLFDLFSSFFSLSFSIFFFYLFFLSFFAYFSIFFSILLFGFFFGLFFNLFDIFLRSF